jgi:hypothetical protein
LSPPAVAEDPAKKRKLFREVCYLVSAWRKSVSPPLIGEEDLPALDAWTTAEIRASQRRLENASRERAEHKEMIAIGSVAMPDEEEKQPPTLAADLANVLTPESQYSGQHQEDPAPRVHRVRPIRRPSGMPEVRRPS